MGVLGDRGFGLVENCLIIKEEYRQRVDAKVWEIFETHPFPIAAIRNGEASGDGVATSGVIVYFSTVELIKG